MRQAHPGPEVPPYRSFEQKQRDGERYKDREAIPWDVLVDDLHGTTHQAYGGLSDPIYLVGVDGRVAFYNMFANAPAVHAALEALFAQGRRGVVRGGVDHFPHLGAALTNGWPALVRGLPQSVIDLMIAAPGSPLAVWLGWKLRPLLAPLTLRAKPLPFPLVPLLALVGLVGMGAVVGWLRAWIPHAPIRQRETKGWQPHGKQPKAVPHEAQHGSRPIQLTHDGTGPLFHRRYRVDIAHPTRSAEQIMAEIHSMPNNFSPVPMARFEKTQGQPGRMQVGDEFYIHIAGPWDGPVRVIDVTPTSFALITLDGHLEAGEVAFQLVPHPTRADALRFEINSWARSRDKLVDFAYNHIQLVKAAQTNMWAYFCQRVVAASGGERLGEIDIMTEESPYRGEVIPRES